MNLKYLVLLLFCASTLNAERAKPGCFRAAVFDQVRQVDQHSIPKTIELNLNLYERAAVKAKENVCGVYFKIIPITNQLLFLHMYTGCRHPRSS